MKIQQTLNFMRKVLIDNVPGAEVGNCYVVAIPLPVPQLGVTHVQIYHSGSGGESEDGGNLVKRTGVGIRIYQRLVTDEFAKLQQAGASIQTMSRKIVQALHLRYDLVEVPLQEPIKYESESSVRMVQDDNTTILYADINFKTVLYYTAAEVAEIDT